MTIRLLKVSNPSAYAKGSTDVPLGYARLAAHPDVELHHADTRAMLTPGAEIACVEVPAGFDPDAFGELAQEPTRKLPARAFDLAFCRTLKPFPPGYLPRLVAWSEAIPFVNDPSGIQRQLAPGFVLEAAGPYLPPWRLAREPADVDAFLAEHGTIVAKRANSCGGRGVYRVSPAGGGGLESDNVVEGGARWEDAEALWRHLAGTAPEPVLLMRFLPRVVEGDKRLVVMGGEIRGAYLRRSPSRHWVQNVSQGAVCERVEVTDADRAVVDATWRHYDEHGIRLLGYDLIADEAGWRVSEINAGNVGGLFRLESLGEAGITDGFVESLTGLARRP